MANEQNLTPWKPGQSGNPSGYSRGRRISDALVRFMEERGLTEELAATIFGKVLGRSEFLEYIDADGKKRRRKPDLRWLEVLLEQLGQAARDSDAESGGVGPMRTGPPQVMIPDADDRHARDRPAS